MTRTHLLAVAALAMLLAGLAVLPGCYVQEAYTFSIVPGRLPDGFVGRSYYAAIELSYSYQPVSTEFRLVNGTLPPGLALAPNGALVGYPTFAGTYDFIVQAYVCWGDPYYGGSPVDCQTADQPFSITVYP